MAEPLSATRSYHGVNPPVKTFLTAQQVAKLYGVTVVTIREWAKDGRIKALRVGRRGHFRFDAAQLPKVCS
jgi:excisionase family DNA binding protein